jgi:hypothetical protein
MLTVLLVVAILAAIVVSCRPLPKRLSASRQGRRVPAHRAAGRRS